MVRDIRRSRFGQIRILEAVVASILIFIVFSAAVFMLFSSERVFRQEAVDLNRLAYNVLHRLAESGVIDEALKGGQINTGKLTVALRELLPQNIYFNLTIYAMSRQDGVRSVVSVSNAQQSVFERSSEVASASITYTSSSGVIYQIVLKLTRVGLASLNLYGDYATNICKNIYNYNRVMINYEKI